MANIKGVLLDTNILIEITNGRQDTFDEYIVPGVPYFVSVISVMELFAFSGMSEEEESRIARLLDFLHILPASMDIAILAGRLSRTRRKAKFDMLIAATAIFWKLPVVTKNVKDFKNISDLEVRTTI